MSVAIRDYLIEFDEAEHIYYVNGERKASVTQMLKAGGVVNDQWYTEQHRWRGSVVHKATADEDSGKIAKFDPQFGGFFKAWQTFKKERKFRPAMVEKIVYDPILDICGTLDRLGCFESGPIDVLIDLKTSNSGVIPAWVALQTVAYGHALDPKAIYRRMAVVLMPDGTYRVDPYPADTYQKHMADWQTLVRAVGVQREYGN
jgi:hypothetical protein